MSDIGKFDERMRRHEDEFRHEEFLTYNCTCGYVFRHKAGERIDRCPYCGRDPSAFKKEPTAQDFLDEVE